MKTLIDGVWHYDIDEIAEQTENHRKTIMGWCRTGKLKGVKAGRDWYVSDVELSRYFPRWKRAKMPQRRPKLLLTCYHESGHAVIACHLKLAFEYVTTEPRGDSLGHMTYLKRWSSGLSLDELVRRLVVVLAGPMAEARHQGVTYEPTGISRDALVDLLIGHEPSFEARYALFRYIEQKATYLVHMVWGDIERVARRLEERAALTRNEVAGMMEDA